MSDSEPFAYFIRFRVQAGSGDAVKALLEENRQHLEEVEGALLFAGHRSQDDAHEFWIYEAWRTRQALDDETATEASRAWTQRLREHVLEGTVSRTHTNLITSPER